MSFIWGWIWLWCGGLFGLCMCCCMVKGALPILFVVGLLFEKRHQTHPRQKRVPPSKHPKHRQPARKHSSNLIISRDYFQDCLQASARLGSNYYLMVGPSSPLLQLSMFVLSRTNKDNFQINFGPFPTFFAEIQKALLSERKDL